MAMLVVVIMAKLSQCHWRTLVSYILHHAEFFGPRGLCQVL
jgi:hypothetical protein